MLFLLFGVIIPISYLFNLGNTVQETSKNLQVWSPDLDLCVCCECLHGFSPAAPSSSRSSNYARQTNCKL